MSTERQLWKAVDQILWIEWDPLGVNDFEDARDEYQSYISEIVIMLHNESSTADIGEHLFQVAKSQMGIVVDRKRDDQVAEKLVIAWNKILSG